MLIAIRSKNRPNTKQHLEFKNLDYKCIYFLEPQDFNKYDVPNKISIQQNDKGLSFANNYILEYCKNNKIKNCLLSDDDIKDFGIVKNKKCIKKNDTIWEQILQISNKLPFTVIGISQRQYAWSESKKYSINKKPVGGIVLLKIDKINWKYDVGMKQDRDFCMQAIINSSGVLKLNHFYFNTGPIGEKKGGSFEFYQNKKDIEAVKYLHNKWKQYTEIIKINNRTDLKFNLKKLAEKYNRPIR